MQHLPENRAFVAHHRGTIWVIIKSESQAPVIYDIVNVLIFGGQRLINEEQLEDATLRSAYKTDGRYHELERDVAKRWINGNIRIACIGIENQTKADEDMPIRILAYDAAEYRSQLNEKDTKERYPVISLVLYMGHEHSWNQPRSLYEMLEIPDAWKSFVSDYKINVFEVAYLPREVIDQFQSDFGIVADYFYQMRKTKNYVPKGTVVRHVQETLSFLSIMTGDHRFEDAANEVKIQDDLGKGKEDGTMEEFLDRIENRGIAKGLEKGITANRAESIRNLMDSLKFTVDQAMDALKIPETEREKLRSML